MGVPMRFGLLLKEVSHGPGLDVVRAFRRQCHPHGAGRCAELSLSVGAGRRFGEVLNLPIEGILVASPSGGGDPSWEVVPARFIVGDLIFSCSCR